MADLKEQTAIPMRPRPKQKARGTSGAPIRSLPVESWPAADRLAWQNACRPSAQLKRGGSASHLREITRNDLSRRYGYFMDFVARSEGLDLDAGLIAYVTPNRVAGYASELEKRVGSVTLHGNVYKLGRTAQLLNPAADLEWLCDLEKDLALVMQPRSKFSRLVYSHTLIEAGLTLMTEAHSVMKGTALQRARQFRNGGMVAFLGFHPIRLKNFAALELGRTLSKVENGWWIVLRAAETKEKSHDERKLDPSLAPWLELYLEKYRPLLNGGNRHDKLLWSSSRGVPMTYKAIERVIKTTTLAAIGVDICPHLFRTSAVSTIAISAPSIPGLGPALLHHNDPGVTGEHYNRAKSSAATQSFGALIRQYRAPKPPGCGPKR